MNNSFLQSRNWKEFQKSLGYKTFEVSGRLVIKIDLPFGQSYLYSPRPVFDALKELRMFLSECEKLAKREGAFFLRYEPDVCDGKVLKKINNFSGTCVTDRQPGQTLVLDLIKNKEEILSNMKSKTRYNIRLAEKKGVEISLSSDVKDINIFYKLSEDTAKRDKIRFHDKGYYKKLAKSFGEEMRIYTAKFNGKAIASAIMLKYKDVYYYLHGASSDKYRNVMAPYLIQWKAICDGKKAGCKWYDFWGVAPLKRLDSNNKFDIKNPSHAWNGITKFKLGFVPNEDNGKYLSYPGCFEVSYGKKRYFLFNMFKKVR